MLILTRKIGESITIEDGAITVSVMEIKGRQVCLGIDASGRTIHRQEIYLKIKEANEQALNASLSDLDILEATFFAPKNE